MTPADLAAILRDSITDYENAAATGDTQAAHDALDALRGMTRVADRALHAA